MRVVLCGSSFAGRPLRVVLCESSYASRPESITLNLGVCLGHCVPEAQECVRFGLWHVHTANGPHASNHVLCENCRVIHWGQGAGVEPTGLDRFNGPADMVTDLSPTKLLQVPSPCWENWSGHKCQQLAQAVRPRFYYSPEPSWRPSSWRLEKVRKSCLPVGWHDPRAFPPHASGTIHALFHHTA